MEQKLDLGRKRNRKGKRLEKEPKPLNPHPGSPLTRTQTQPKPPSQAQPSTQPKTRRPSPSPHSARPTPLRGPSNPGPHLGPTRALALARPSSARPAGRPTPRRRSPAPRVVRPDPPVPPASVARCPSAADSPARMSDLSSPFLARRTARRDLRRNHRGFPPQPRPRSPAPAFNWPVSLPLFLSPLPAFPCTAQYLRHRPTSRGALRRRFRRRRCRSGRIEPSTSITGACRVRPSGPEAPRHPLATSPRAPPASTVDPRRRTLRRTSPFDPDPR